MNQSEFSEKKILAIKYGERDICTFFVVDDLEYSVPAWSAAFVYDCTQAWKQNKTKWRMM